MTGGTLTVEGEGDRGHTHCSGGRVTGGTLTVVGEGDRGHTHCSGGRASGSAGCTGVPIPLSPSLGAPVPCRERQSRVRGENTELEGQLGCLPGRVEK